MKNLPNRQLRIKMRKRKVKEGGQTTNTERKGKRGKQETREESIKVKNRDGGRKR